MSRWAEVRQEAAAELAAETGLGPVGAARLADEAAALAGQAEAILTLAMDASAPQARGTEGEVAPLGWGLEALMPWLVRDWGPSSEIVPVAARLGAALWRHLGDPSTARIAFPGCGAGGLAARLSGRFAAGYAYDLALPGLWVLRHVLNGGTLDLPVGPPGSGLGRLSARGVTAPALRVMAMDARRTAFADGSMDVVVTAFLLDLMADPHALMAEIARTLRAGGLWLNYGPTGPRGGLYHLTGVEVGEIAAPHGFGLRETLSHRATLFDVDEVDPGAAWQSHVCHLSVLEKAWPASAVAARAEAVAEATVLHHYPGAVIERRDWPGDGQSISFAHQRAPGRVERFAIGPGLAAALIRVDGRLSAGALAESLVADGLARGRAEGLAAYSRLIREGLIRAGG